MNPFIVARSDALLDPELHKYRGVFMTLCAISTFTTRDKNGFCYFKQNTIGELIGKSRQGISKDLLKLEELGYLRIIQQQYHGKQSNNKYQLLYDTPLKNTVQPDDAAPQLHDAHAVQPDDAPKYSYINTKKEKKALSRNEFLRGLSKRLKDGYFENIIDKDCEAIVNTVGHNAFDHWEGYGFPPNDVYAAFKGYLRRARTDAKLSKHLKDNTEKKTPEPPELSQWRARVTNFQKGMQWLSDWGAEPNQPNTRVPKAILKDFDFTNQPEKELENA